MLSKRENALHPNFQLIEKAPFPVPILSGGTLKVQYANIAAAVAFSKSNDDLVGRDLIHGLPELFSAAEIRSIIEVCQLHGQPWRVEEKRVISGTTDFVKCFRVECEPIAVEGQTLDTVACYLTDITTDWISRTSLESRYDYLNSFFKVAPVAIVCYRGEDFIVDVANDHALAMWGKTLADVIGKPIDVVFPNVKSDPVIWQRHSESVERMKRGERHIVSEVELVFNRNGRRHTGWYTYIHEPYTDNQGKVVGMMAIAIEVTDQVVARKKLQLITDSLPALIAYIDNKEQYTFVNRTYEAWFGKDSASVIGKPVAEVLGESAYKDLSVHIKKALAGTLHSYEGWVAYKDGGKRYISASYIPHVDESRNVLGYVSLVNDLTEKKNQEERLRQFNSELETEVRNRTNELSIINDLLKQKNEELSQTYTFLQQLIDSSIEFVAVVDNDRRFTVVNKAFEQFVGRTREQLLGKGINEVFPDAEKSEQAVRLKEAFGGETVHIKTNPSFSKRNVWFDTYYIPLTVNGSVQGVIMMSRDITSIVESEQELLRLNRQLEDAQKLAKLGSWEWNVTTGEIVWSDEMYNVYGYDSIFPVDFAKATERMSEEDAMESQRRTDDHIQKAATAFRATGERVWEIDPVEYVIKLPGGQQKTLRSSGKLYLSPDGKLDRILGAVQDVTQIRSTEQQLRSVVLELESKNKELQSFNYVVSHDLKEPLRKIQTFIDRIKSEGTGSLENHLSRIDSSAARMRKLIESILSLSQVSNKEIEFKEVDLNTVLANSKSDLEVRIKETHAEILCAGLPTVKASEPQMNQIFSNLIGNSLKFSKSIPRIEISYRRVKRVSDSIDTARSDYWCITFADNGIGFDLTFKDRIFEPFQRLHSKAEYSGTGIGLSIVKRIVEQHHGFIEVESQPGAGTTFSIYLPVDTSIV